MNRKKKIVITLFIFLNLLSMARVHLPLETKFFSSIYRPVDFYLSFFSIYQDWMMFAKNPSRTNLFLTADIEFTDGTIETYHFPNPNNLKHIEKYNGGERFRKILSESVMSTNKSFLYQDVARYALRKVKYHNFEKIPKKVHLKKHYSHIPDIDKKFIPHQSNDHKYHSVIFFTHEVI